MCNGVCMKVCGEEDKLCVCERERELNASREGIQRRCDGPPTDYEAAAFRLSGFGLSFGSYFAFHFLLPTTMFFACKEREVTVIFI